RSIDQYLSAIELLAEGKADFVELKQQAEAHFNDALKLFPIWLTPNLLTQDIPLKAGLFDCVVIDEASQCDIPSALPLLFRARRIVVIGDERQPSHVATLPDSVNQQLSERHAIGIGTNYDYKLYSLFNLAANSVAGGPGQILLDEH
ncbi:MAG: AAA domain-containing protein, partial [Anaerolineae bacterium]